MNFTMEELRGLKILEGLPDKEIRWFCENGDRVDLGTGERLFERGDAADNMVLVVRGAIDGYEEIGGQWRVVATTHAGEVTGMLPFSRMTHYPRYTVAVEPTCVLQVRKSDFPDMLTVSLEVGQRLVAEMSDRVRGDVRLEQQQEKMMALGKLSAGLAHELNNPAAAVGRAAATLSEHFEKLPDCVTGLMELHLDETAIKAIRELPILANPMDSLYQSALRRADLEESLSDWLEDHGIENNWRLAGTLADAGIGVARLEEFSTKIPPEALSDALTWIECGLAAETIVAEISSSAERISSLIDSVKTYSHMDRSVEHKPIDVRDGLENTLRMLNHKINRKGVRLAREYADDLPMILANAGELNQVWTNLIDNAADAAAEGGKIRIVAVEDDLGVVVSVIDDGPGIPEDLRKKVFDPFFTTKEVGKGTGLGLDIAQRIARMHRGRIEVVSKPGRNEMRVHLPRKTS